ncbi:MAG: type II toxin-antitoxin system death-on-curing family toxin [Verrucomicrobiales bacterium]
MTDPDWVELDECLMIHDKLIAAFGGLNGIRDKALLESALGRPRQTYHYENADPFELAASYAHGIIKNHPFLDGNKRTAFVTAVLFLESNGYQFTATQNDATTHTLALADSSLSQKSFTHWLRQNTTPKAT